MAGEQLITYWWQAKIPHMIQFHQQDDDYGCEESQMKLQ